MPSGCHNLIIEASGAAGGPYKTSGRSFGGSGGLTKVQYNNVDEGQSFSLNIGSFGGLYYSNSITGSGGHYTAFYLGTNPTAANILVLSGGGGYAGSYDTSPAYGGNGGANGNGIAANTVLSNGDYSYGGQGGTLTAGGLRGCRHSTLCGTNGSFLTGGAGYRYLTSVGPAGGSGYYGGGGSAPNGGAGGGSGYVSPDVTVIEATSGGGASGGQDATGGGYITLTWN